MPWGSDGQKQGTSHIYWHLQLSQQSPEQQHEVKADRDLMVHVDEEVRGLWPCRNSGPGTWKADRAHTRWAQSGTALLSKRGVA